MQILFVSMFFIGIIMILIGYFTLYPIQIECKSEENELKLLEKIMEDEVLKGKSNIQETDDLTEFQFRQKPSEIYNDMFSRNNFNL